MSSSTAKIGFIDPDESDIPLRQDRFTPNQAFPKGLRLAARVIRLLCAVSPKPLATCDQRQVRGVIPFSLTVIPM